MKSFTEDYKNIIVPIILEVLPNAKIILYGSRARNAEGLGSDIDIALDYGKRIDDRKIDEIIEKLTESLLPIKFDIVDYQRVSDRLKNEILKDGVVWHS